MSAVVVVWKEKDGQLVNTYRDEDGRIRVMDVATLDEQQGTWVTDEEQLLTLLDQADSKRIYADVVLAREVLGWDV